MSHGGDVGVQEFAKVELRDSDVLTIIRTLEYDGLVESKACADAEVFCPAKQRVPEKSAFTSIPCGVCPV